MEKKINFYLTVSSIPKDNSYFLVANGVLDSDLKNYLLENLNISDTESNNILIVNNLNELNNYPDKNIHLLISPENYVWGYEAIIKINNNLDKHHYLINKVVKDESEKYIEVNRDCISYLQNNAKLHVEEINLAKNQLIKKAKIYI